MKIPFNTAILITHLIIIAMPIYAQKEINTASYLSKAVSADIEAAKTKYLNQTIQIKGTVARTYISRYMTSCVELVSDGTKVTFVLPYSGVNRGVSKLSDFKPGQMVTMEGRVTVINNELFLLKDGMVVK